MQTTLRIEDSTYREAKMEAARRGMTLTRFIESALQAFVAKRPAPQVDKRAAEIAERDALMEKLLHRTARFRVGKKPTRAEMNER